MKKTGTIISLSLILAISGCKDQKDPVKSSLQNKKKVEVIQTSKKESARDLNYSGIVQPSNSTPLSFQLPGMVKMIYADEGDYVTKDQLLAVLNKTTLQNSYAMAQASQEQTQDAYDRLENVYNKGSLPEIEWEEIKAKLQQANSALRIAGQNLKNAEIRAPRSGVIGSRNLEVGSIATPGISVFTLIQTDKLYVRISVPENEIGKLQIGDIGTVTIPAIGTKQMVAKIDKVGVMANIISKTYEVKLIIENPGQKIKPGMVCDIHITPEQAQSTLSLPYRAVLKDNSDNAYVYKIDPDSHKARKHSIEISGFENNSLRVSHGLEEGDLVVTRGMHKLKDGDQVILQN